MSTKTPAVAGDPTQTGTALLETATAAIQGFGPINQIHQHLCAYFPFLRARHDEAGGGAPLLRAPERGHEAVPDLRQPRCRRPANRSRIPDIGGAVLDVAGDGEAAVALARVRGEERNTVHAGGPGAHPEAGHGEDREDVRQDLPLLADAEKRFGISFEEEREKRAYMKGPDHGIHPKANGEGKGWQTQLREISIKPTATAADPTATRVFV
ncbi:hypothetical protein TIFTF001_035519 [Ficus carica]|uniref:Uncharacterized protein n=1 Tax=Ficus carica TaxID=3494 RepID=A0AA88E1R1_FICCA|nr:hypothetical protein TIFTF001_035519 [Ficus carica]